jgi:hypothetical protein
MARKQPKKTASKANLATVSKEKPETAPKEKPRRPLPWTKDWPNAAQREQLILHAKDAGAVHESLEVRQKKQAAREATPLIGSCTLRTLLTVERFEGPTCSDLC